MVGKLGLAFGVGSVPRSPVTPSSPGKSRPSSESGTVRRRARQRRAPHDGREAGSRRTAHGSSLLTLSRYPSIAARNFLLALVRVQALSFIKTGRSSPSRTRCRAGCPPPLGRQLPRRWGRGAAGVADHPRRGRRKRITPARIASELLTEHLALVLQQLRRMRRDQKTFETRQAGSRRSLRTSLS